MRMQKWLMFLLASMALVGVVLALDAVRDDAGDTLRQVTEGEGNPGPLTFDEHNRLWIRDKATDQNTRGSALVAVTVDTWTALSGIGTQRYMQIICRNTTDAATATLNIWGSDDGGTTYWPMVRADTLAKAKDVAIDVGTDFNPTETAGSPNVDTIIVAVGPSTHIYIDAEGGATAGFTYEAGGL